MQDKYKIIHINDENSLKLLDLLGKFAPLAQQLQYSNNYTLNSENIQLILDLYKTAAKANDNFSMMIDYIAATGTVLEGESEPIVDLKKGYAPQSQYIKYIMNNADIPNFKSYVDIIDNLVQKILNDPNTELTSEQKVFLAESIIFLIQQIIIAKRTN